MTIQTPIRCVFPLAAALASLVSPILLRAQPVALVEPFRLPYEGGDTTGSHVIACWTFDGDHPGRDVSGNGHDLTLRGETRYVAEGRFGACLESFPAGGQSDRPQGAQAANHPHLSPAGAFTLEAWVKAKPEMKDQHTAFLIDKKYYNYAKDIPRANHDYCLYMNKRRRDGRRQLVAHLGYGRDSEAYTSDAFRAPTNEWTHIAFTYDGRGTGRFCFNGRSAGQTVHEGRRAVSPGPYAPVIGCRYGSTHQGFPGFIDQVRICEGAREFSPASFEHRSLRKAFVRMEKDARLQFALINRSRKPLNNARVHFNIGGMGTQVMTAPLVPPGEQRVIACDVDTSLRPDAYTVAATIEIPGNEPFRSTQTFDIAIVPRPRPDIMPVVMWGAGLDEVDRLKDLGFTHTIGLPCDLQKIWEAGDVTDAVDPSQISETYEKLDHALKQGIGVVASLSPGGRWARTQEAFQRVDANGKPYSRHDVCARFPEIPRFCYNVGASMSRTFGAHPAWQSALVHTEVRGHANLCYHDHDQEACREALGFEIPDGLHHMRGTPYNKIDCFPADRVIADDDRRYAFYRWWWKMGDGWNALHTALHDGVKSGGNGDVWTFHDPAARVASTYGNGGNVDVLSHWTYSYPDPIRIGMCADELFAMAGGSSNRNQQVMKMTQIIWYRSQTAPASGEEAGTQTAAFDDHDASPRGTGIDDDSGKYRASWEVRIPDARFITIAPMHLREAFWTKIARPIKGIMYHGWQSLVDCPRSTSSYRHTHPDTKHELRRLVRTVVEPLGPTLTQIPDRPADVAFLESFASQMFAGRGTYGWNGGWAGDAYLILLYAQLQPEIIYEETVMQRDLDRFKVLVLVDCDILPRSVVERVQRFRQRGGLVVGDENLCPAVEADILLPRHDRPKRADAARALLLKKATDVHKALAPHYPRHAWSENHNVVTRTRSCGSTDYLFAINDRREYGDYVGHHGFAMENGLPQQTELFIRRDGVHVYDLVAHRAVNATTSNGVTRIPVALGPCEGRLFMLTERAIAAVRVEATKQATPGDTVSVQVAVVDGEGTPVDAIVPVHVEILDPHGRASEFSGAYGARDGRVTIDFCFAPNDAPGLWRVHGRELAAGTTTDAYMRLAPSTRQ